GGGGWTGGRSLLAGTWPGSNASADRRAAGDASNYTAADQPISQSDEELLAGRGDRLPGFGAGFHGHRAQPDRPGGRGRRDYDARLSCHQPDDLIADEHLQPAHSVDGTVRAPT